MDQIPLGRPTGLVVQARPQPPAPAAAAAQQAYFAGYGISQASPVGASVVDPYRDITGKYAHFVKSGWNWRWFNFPNLYYPPGIKYAKREEKFVFEDVLGRKLEYIRPFDCTISTENGRLETLYVQASDSICELSKTSPNATWKRTCVRNVSPFFLRLSNLPFVLIPSDRRNDPERYTESDRWSIAVMWIPSVIALEFALLFGIVPFSHPRPIGKLETHYLGLPYGDLRFPLLAKNYLENRSVTIQRGLAEPMWSSSTASNYRTFRPKYLFEITRIESEDGIDRYRFDKHPVSQRDSAPYLFISWSWVHYQVRRPRDIERDPRARAQLLASALKAAVKYYESLNDDPHNKRFWISAGCLNSNIHVSEDGQEYPLSLNDPDYEKKKHDLANQDTYSISDIIRGAEAVVVLSWSGDNPYSPDNDNVLKVWGQQVWTFPEIVLSQGNQVPVAHLHYDAYSNSVVLDRFERIPKHDFPYRAWTDSNTSRQLLENYSTLHLSRLELIKIALECVMKRDLRLAYDGDRSYALMGLLRIRPPIDKSDTSFQAFARMSFPQDSDRLMERMISLLPHRYGESWEHMTDQYRCTLWDIWPEVHVCAVGENDTVVVDCAKGAQIQWSTFHNLTVMKRDALRAIFIPFIVYFSPILIIACAVAAVATPSAGPFLAILALAMALPLPWLVWKFYGGKYWGVEPAFFGIEGFVPVEVIEESLFGVRQNRMKWSPYSSPLQRHVDGTTLKERKVSASSGNVEAQSLLPDIETYSVKAINPCSPCGYCASQNTDFGVCDKHETYASCQERSRSRMGEMKVFTLVDTLNMQVTIFHAIRPPTALIVTGSEGGMKRALACSLDVTTGTFYRETVLRLPSRCVDHMFHLDRIRLGLHRPFEPRDIEDWSQHK